jgi:hypothetical protein
VDRRPDGNGKRRGAGSGQCRPSRELGGIGDLLGIDEREMCGDLPCHNRVPGTAQLFHEPATAGIEERGDVMPGQSYDGSPGIGPAGSPEKQSATSR